MGRVSLVGGDASRIRHLDGWRGLAIIMVLLGHFGRFAPELAGYGVELFFVLSGRLMSQILFEKRVALPTFFKRRFSRIYPALMVLVIGLGALSVVATLVGNDRGIDPLSAIAALTFTVNYMPTFGYRVAGTLDHIWSLSVEEHCYAILAILALATARQSKWIIPVCSALALLAMMQGVRLYLQGVGGVHEIYWRTDVRLAPVFLSAAIYLCKPTRGGALALSLSLPLFLVLPLPLNYVVPTLLLAYSVNAIDHAGDRMIRFLSSPALIWIGLFSYSLYLWQQLFYKLTGGNLMGVPPALTIAWLSYKYVEVPARNAINSIRLSPRRYA